MDKDELASSWKIVTHALKRDFDMPASTLAFLELAQPVAVDDGVFLLMAANDLTKRMLEERVHNPVLELLRQQLAQPDLQLRVVVDPQAFAEMKAAAADLPDPVDALEGATLRVVETSAAELDPTPVATAARPLSVVPTPTAPDATAGVDRWSASIAPEDAFGRRPRDKRQSEPTRLNPKYTFDTFVIGASNRFAHAAAVAVAEAPAQAYNPLFIYGDSGLGKTHLLHAIGDYAQHLYRDVKVRFVNSEEFTNEFINSIRDERTSSFQLRYRDVDVLLIDDIQFLQGKVQTQEEFFHTFNALHQSQKQVVITSDVPPRALSGFEERMRSRFEWGLLTDIQPPDLETRIAILRKKAIADHLAAPDEVLEYIGSNIATNIRELEGALIRVTAFANLSKQPVTLPLAQNVLKDLIGDQAQEITSALIITRTAEYFTLAEADLIGPSRNRTLVMARQIAMYLCREMTQLSLPKIGEAFGKRDHTTVMHAERKIRKLMAEKLTVYQQVSELAVKIRQHV